MSISKIDKLYNETLKVDNGSRLVKFDLHIHTPSSKDYSAPLNMTEDEIYIKILDEILEYSIEIVAITDHNTFRGYNRIIEIQKENKKYKDILILCGIEITCFSKHILAIFNSGFSKNKQITFLNKIGLSEEDQGNEKSFADELSPVNLMKEINDFGGISILAHVDAEHGFLYEICKESKNNIEEISFEGKSLGKILTSPYLFGLQVVRKTNYEKINKLLLNTTYNRKDRKLGLLLFSDSHGIVCEEKYSGNSGSSIGSDYKYSVTKMSDISFNSLKLALSDAEIRILDDINPKYDYPIILGASISSSVFNKYNEFTHFRFNNEMNCIIGARGTGKSTLLDIIKHTLLFDYDIKKKRSNISNNIISRIYESVVFLQYEKNIYAFYYKPSFREEYGERSIDNRKTQRKIYILKSKKFELMKNGFNKLKNIMISNYGQRQLYEYSKNSNKIIDIIDDFLKWQHQEQYYKILGQIESNEQKLEELVDKVNGKIEKINKKFIEEIYDNDDVKELKKLYTIIMSNKIQLYELRKNMITQVNQLLKGIIKITNKNFFNPNDIKYLTEELPYLIQIKENSSYDLRFNISKIFQTVTTLGQYIPKFDFVLKLLNKDYSSIEKDYNLSQIDNVINYLDIIRNNITGEMFLIFVHDSVEMEYNINSGRKNTTETYRKNNQLSLGQNAVAILLLILSVAHNSKDARPLVMDQPEDDLDNSYIYTTLVKEFRKAKQNRQLLISTHNANIPVSSDAENIIVLKYNGNYGYFDCNGSIDRPIVANSVLEILEGGKDALKQRNSKYL